MSKTSKMEQKTTQDNVEAPARRSFPQAFLTLRNLNGLSNLVTAWKKSARRNYLKEQLSF